MQLLRIALTLFGATYLTACVTVDRNVAASLGTAGMQATQALSTQAAGAMQTLGDLNQWWGVHDTLVCVHSGENIAGDNEKAKAQKKTLKEACVKGVSVSAEPANVKQIVAVLTKGKQAIDALNQAYSAFVDLAHYNAGQEATAALKTSFSDINGFLQAAAALPGAAALGTISTTVEKVAGGAVALFADSRQNAQILATNTDLQTASDALHTGLTTERDAMTSLLQTLQSERQALYESGFDAGLIDPTDILTPVFSEAYPGVRLQKPAAENQFIVTAAAHNVLAFQDQQTSAAVAASYADSLSALEALSAQHAKLAKQQTLNIDQIQTEVSNLKADISQMTGSSTSSSTTSSKTN